MSRIEPVKPAAKFRNPLRTKRNSVIAGAVIVVVSVIAINFAIRSLSGAHEYLVAQDAAAAGTPMKSLPMRTVSLNLGEAAGDYLTPADKLGDTVLTQPLGAGNLILKRDVASADANNEWVRLSLTAKTSLPTKLAAGSRVDLWAAINDGSGQFGDPQLIAQDIQVYSTGGGSGLFAEAANKLEVEVMQGDVKPILASILGGDLISVVAREGVR